jgi:hypothetical protein
MLQQKNCSGEPARVISINCGCSETHARIVNQIASATITATITPQTAGVTFFELPLRGESFGAWL